MELKNTILFNINSIDIIENEIRVRRAKIEK